MKGMYIFSVFGSGMDVLVGNGCGNGEQRLQGVGHWVDCKGWSGQ